MNMQTKDKLSDKEIKDTFKKIGDSGQKKDSLEEWMKKSEFEQLNSEDVWIVSDSTSAFSHFNQE